jgi:hypothetical protein
VATAGRRVPSGTRLARELPSQTPGIEPSRSPDTRKETNTPTTNPSNGTCQPLFRKDDEFKRWLDLNTEKHPEPSTATEPLKEMVRRA